MQCGWIKLPLTLERWTPKVMTFVILRPKSWALFYETWNWIKTFRPSLKTACSVPWSLMKVWNEQFSFFTTLLVDGRVIPRCLLDDITACHIFIFNTILLPSTAEYPSTYSLENYLRCLLSFPLTGDCHAKMPGNPQIKWQVISIPK